MVSWLRWKACLVLSFVFLRKSLTSDKVAVEWYRRAIIIGRGNWSLHLGAVVFDCRRSSSSC